METISVVLATFNEEKNLPGCLESVKDLADEIVVVDGGSSDKTIEIAKQYKAKTKITTNPPIFHINKQKAIDMAKKDWILQLDADERVTKALAKEIKELLQYRHSGDSEQSAEDSRINEGTDSGQARMTASEINGYWIPRKNWFLGRFLMKGGQYPDYTLRFYRKGKGRLPQKSVHEQAIVDGKVGYLKNPLIHIADQSFERYLIRFNRYTNLIAEELKDEKIDYNPIMTVKYLLILPVWWFVLTYFRHKGFMDLWQGFVFSFFSSLRYPISYIKYITRK